AAGLGRLGGHVARQRVGPGQAEGAAAGVAGAVAVDVHGVRAARDGAGDLGRAAHPVTGGVAGGGGRGGGGGRVERDAADERAGGGGAGVGGPALRGGAVGQDPHGGALTGGDAVGVELDGDARDLRAGGRGGRLRGRGARLGGGGLGRRGCLRLGRTAHQADREYGPRARDSPDPEHRRTPLRRSSPSIHRFRGHRPPDTQNSWADPYW